MMYREKNYLKANYIGIIGAIIAFISLALPWWTMSMSATAEGTSYSVDVSVYPYQATATALGVSQSVAISIWYGSVALALVIISGVLGIVGSVTALGKKLLIGGGVLALLAIIIFAAGLQNELSATAVIPDVPVVGLFSSGSYNFLGISMNYSTYLSFGFWIALVSAIIMFAAIKTQPAEKAPAPAPAPQPPT
jgi:hypothetical protein